MKEPFIAKLQRLFIDIETLLAFLLKGIVLLNMPC